jgi:hypothetical protein
MSEDTGERICTRCQYFESEHVVEKCLYASTCFEPMDCGLVVTGPEDFCDGHLIAMRLGRWYRTICDKCDNKDYIENPHRSELMLQ